MNTEQANQLRLAATILETGHPWHLYRAGKLYDADPKAPPQYYASRPAAPEGPFEIRLALAVPPDGRSLHNPDDLDAETMGAGWRLTLAGEEPHDEAERWSAYDCSWRKREYAVGLPYGHQDTYRVPLSVPWPGASKPDPYVELKAAHAAGKVIQYNCGDDSKPEWEDVPDPEFGDGPQAYRIKPEEPAFHLPPPPPGMRWHREDGWQEGDLPQGWRPCVKDERETMSGFMQSLPGRDFGWVGATYHSSGLDHYSILHRTRRPLIFEHEGKTWTWHRPGDPMPCDGNAKICVLTQGGDSNSDKDACKARVYAFGDLTEAGLKRAEIIGWRYADEKKTVPLGKNDIPPCSVITGKDGGWAMVTGVGDDGVTVDTRDEPVSFEELAGHAKINRSIPLTGKWDANAWEPCHKQI